MTPYVLHLRRSLFVFVAPILAVAGTVLAWSNVYPQVMSSANIVNVLNSTGATLAPVLAGFAAWDGLRERRNGGAPIIDSAAQPSARILLSQWLAGLTYTASIFVVLVAALHVRALWYTLADSPLWLNLGVVLTVLCLATSGGYLFAGILKHWSAVIVAALPPALLYGYSLLVPGVGLVQSLVPFGSRGGNDFLVPNPPFFTGQLLFLGGILFFMVGVTLLLSKSDRWSGALLAPCAIIAMASGAWVVDAENQRWGIPVEDSSGRLVAITSTDDSLTLKVLPTYLPVREELLQRWERVQDMLADTPGAFVELRQQSDAHPDAAPEPGGLTAIYLNPSSPMIATDSVMESLSDLHTADCETSSTIETALVAFWLAGDGAERFSNLIEEDATALAMLQRMSTDEGQAWMSQNYSSFIACTIEKSDFPRP